MEENSKPQRAEGREMAKSGEFKRRALPVNASPELEQSSAPALSLTRVAIVGHPEVALQGPLVASELQLQLGIVPHLPPLDVNGGLLLASTGWEMLSPVLFIQLSFSCRGGKAGGRGVLAGRSLSTLLVPAGNANLIIVTPGAAAIKGCFALLSPE